MTDEVDIIVAIRAAIIASGIEKVYDQTAPQNAKMPYVVLGTLTLPERDTDNTLEYSGSLVIHAWDDDKNRRDRVNVSNMQKKIRTALHQNSLSLAGLSNLIQESSDISVDPDNVTRHGVQRYRVEFVSEVLS